MLVIAKLRLQCNVHGRVSQYSLVRSSARINIIWIHQSVTEVTWSKARTALDDKWSNHLYHFAHIKALSSSNNIETLVSIKVTQLALPWEGGPDPWWLVSTFCFASCQTLPDTITSPSPGQARQSWHWCKLKGAPAQKPTLVSNSTTKKWDKDTTQHPTEI